MWLFVFFDLPVETATERKAATRFRKDIMKDGFTMMQFSVYVRHCPSGENADVHLRRVQKAIPEKGQISILRITDKQYGNILNYWGAEKQPLPAALQQLELF